MGANFFTVCKDVKLQLEFNPDKVASYRLIGYENRRLAASDFADDAKDGGEIGAGHRVTALYEIVPASGAAGEDGLKYQTRASTGSADYLTVSVRAKAPDGDASRLYAYPVGEDSVKTEPSDNLRFAAAVAQAGMLLRESPYAGSASFEDVARQLEEIPDLRADPYKDEFAYLVRRLARGEIG
jgi:Ca-activated chloride channel family protein